MYLTGYIIESAAKPKEERSMQSIAIDREYGSGGREVARILSEKLGIPFYDGNLLSMAARERGINIGTIELYDEKGVGSILHDFALMGNATYGGTINPAPFEAYSAMSGLIQVLAKRSPCIFLGRCAGHILKNEAKVPYLHVFIYASDMQQRIRRAIEVDGIERDKVESYIRKKDNQRRNYNKFFTQEEWSARKNYDLLINTSSFGYERAADLILNSMG